MEDLYWGITLAVGLFWAVGAYNRLVRLRGEVIRQWSSVDAVWLRLLVRLQGGIAARQSLATEQDTLELQTLQSACDDLLEALTQARLQPLDAESQKQVVAQHVRLVVEIRMVLQMGPEVVKPDLEVALNRMRQTLPVALVPYHGAVSAYNDALTMRPAAWLGKGLSLKPAIKLDLSAASA